MITFIHTYNSIIFENFDSEHDIFFIFLTRAPPYITIFAHLQFVTVIQIYISFISILNNILIQTCSNKTSVTKNVLKVSQVIQIHHDLFESISQVNRIYGWEVLIGFTALFVTLLNEFYKHAIETNHRLLDNIGGIYFMLVECSVILIVVFPANHFKQQMKLTGWIFHKWELNNFYHNSIDKRVSLTYWYRYNDFEPKIYLEFAINLIFQNSTHVEHVENY